jgi:hypothetical protein
MDEHPHYDAAAKDGEESSNANVIDGIDFSY